MSAPARPRGSGRRSAGRFCACAHARSPSSICVHSRASLRFRSERCAHARAFGLRERHGLGRLGGRQELSKTALQDLARKVRRDSSVRAACPPPIAPQFQLSLSFRLLQVFNASSFPRARIRSWSCAGGLERARLLPAPLPATASALHARAHTQGAETAAAHRYRNGDTGSGCARCARAEAQSGEKILTATQTHRDGQTVTP